MRRVGGLLAAAVIVGSLAAQKSKDLEVLQKEIEALRARLETQAAELEALRKKAAAKVAVGKADAKKRQAELYKRALLVAQLQKAKPAPILVRRAVFKEWGRLSARTINPLLHGDYVKALVALAKARGALDKIKDPKKARAKIDEMNRLLLDARRALWEFEQAAKKKAKEGDRGKQEAGQNGGLVDSVEIFVDTRQLVWDPKAGFPVRGSFSIGRERFTYVAKGGNNPLLRGGYVEALNRVVEGLKLLNKTKDPSKARKAIDAMNRAILDARRALWEFEQKRKQAKNK